MHKLILCTYQDAFYRSLNPAQIELATKSEYDFDSPQAIDFDSIVETLQALKQGLFCEFNAGLGSLLTMAQEESRDTNLLVSETSASPRDNINILPTRIGD